MIYLVLLACTQPTTSPRVPVTPTPEPTPTGDTGEPTVPVERDPWVQVTPQPCARTVSGRVRCWNAESWPVPGYSGVYVPVPERFDGIRTLWANAGGIVWAVTTTGDNVLLQCPSPHEWCNVPERDGRPFVEIGRGFGLQDHGTIVEWNNQAEPGPPFWFSSDVPWTRVGRSTSLVALDANNTVHFGHPFSPGFEYTYTFATERDITEILPWRLAICVRDSGGTVTCVDAEGELENQPFEDPPYVSLRGSNDWEICARRDDDMVTCTDGTAFDAGPIRDFSASVSNRQGEAWEPDVCAITEAGAIVCEGPRYPPDLSAQLPTEDPALGEPLP